MKLIVNADDFGLSPSVNRAIIETFKSGNLTSTTLMVNMPGTADAIRLAKENSGLGIGLHFCITEGFPISTPKTLTNEDGSFLSRKKLLRKLVSGKVDLVEVRNEFEQQLDVLDRSGLSYHHSDSHQHVMMFPAIFKAILPVLEERQLYVRIVRPPDHIGKLLPKRPFKFLRSKANIRWSKGIQKSYPNRSNQFLVSIHDLLDQENLDGESYKGLLSGMDKGAIIEVMVHPYILGNDILEMYAMELDDKMAFLKKSEREYEVLRNGHIFEGHDLITYKDIGA